MNRKIAVLFPGQGSQSIGMGRELYDSFPAAREVFELVDHVLNRSLSKIIFEGEIEELTLTSNTQPALMAVSMAACAGISALLGRNFINDVKIAAGHSLGEYSALCATNAVNLADTTKLLEARGTAMQKVRGAMLALLGIEDIGVAEAIAESASAQGLCEVANDNGAGQIVLSGEEKAIDYAKEIASKYGCPRAIKLRVSSPFHCRLMETAAAIMKLELARVAFAQPTVPVLANVDVSPHTVENIATALTKQITGRVLWRETIEKMHREYEMDTFIEIGAGRVLGGIVSKMIPQSQVYSVHTPQEIETCLRDLGY